VGWILEAWRDTAMARQRKNPRRAKAALYKPKGAEFWLRPGQRVHPGRKARGMRKRPGMRDLLQEG